MQQSYCCNIQVLLINGNTCVTRNLYELFKRCKVKGFNILRKIEVPFLLWRIFYVNKSNWTIRRKYFRQKHFCSMRVSPNDIFAEYHNFRGLTQITSPSNLPRAPRVEYFFVQ